jgi:hypothetical protein
VFEFRNFREMTETNDVPDGVRPWIEQLATSIGGRLLSHYGVAVTTVPLISSYGPEIMISAMLPSEFHWTVRIPNAPGDLILAAEGIAAAFIAAQKAEPIPDDADRRG